jgi:hypothetical protein
MVRITTIPKDADIFWPRPGNPQLEQKFYNSCLLVLHGESGAGKTSLMPCRVLMPRLCRRNLSPGVCPWCLQEPLLAIQRELIHQLRLEADQRFQSRRSIDCKLRLPLRSLHQRIKGFLGGLPNRLTPAQRALSPALGLELFHYNNNCMSVFPQGKFGELLGSILSNMATRRRTPALEALLEAAQNMWARIAKIL